MIWFGENGENPHGLPVRGDGITSNVQSVVMGLVKVKVKSAFPTCVRDMDIEVCGDRLNVVCMAVDKALVIDCGMLSIKLAAVFNVQLVEIGFDVVITKSVLAPKTGVTVIGVDIVNVVFHCGSEVKDGEVGF